MQIHPCKLPCKECLTAEDSCGKQVNGSTLLRESIMTRMKILDWSGMLHQCKMLVAHAATIQNAIKHVRSLNIGFFSDPLIVRWYFYDACHYCQSMCLQPSTCQFTQNGVRQYVRFVSKRTQFYTPVFWVVQ